MTDLDKRGDFDYKPVIEAILFVSGTAVKYEKLKKIVKLDIREIRDIITELNVAYKKNGHSLKIIEVANGFQLVTRNEFSEWIKQLLDKKTLARITPAGLEVLAIIAYKQPVTKAQVEFVRGVNSDSLVQTLLESSMIQIVGRSEELGRPFLYGTTDKFLEYFALKSLKDLPDIKELEEVLSEKVEEQKEKVDKILGEETDDGIVKKLEEERQKRLEEEKEDTELEQDFEKAAALRSLALKPANSA